MSYLFVSNDLNVVGLLCDRSVIAVSLQGAAGDEAISTDRVLSGPRCFVALAMTVRGRRFDLIDTCG
jgi:hypothetical protein